MRNRPEVIGLSLALMLAIASPAYANYPAPTVGDALLGYAIALTVTIAFELLAAALLGVRGRGLVAVVLLNIVTNPALVAALSALERWVPYLALLLILETLVVAIEWLVLIRVLKEWSRTRVLRLAIAMNLASLLGGAVVVFVGAHFL